MTIGLSILFGAWIAMALIIAFGVSRGASVADRKREELDREAGVDLSGGEVNEERNE